MNTDKFIKSREVLINEKTFIVSKIPAMDAIPIYNEVAKSVAENGILGITMLPSKTIRDMMSYTALVDEDGISIVPNTESVFNSIFSEDFGSLQTLVVEMVKENFDFFVSGNLLEKLVDKTKATDFA